ncbi:hypothetical protein MMRN_47710 [Mycobacterium marinum]|nr:hypothetical protein MMRN_47710 [Mycobacterium marinum]
MDPEIRGNLLQRNLGITVAGDPDNVVAELLRVRLRHSDILPAQPRRTRHIRCHLFMQQTHNSSGPAVTPPDYAS